MASPKVFANVPAGTAWSSVEGAAAGVAGVTWQNLGPGHVAIAFTTAAPAGGATDAFHVLKPYDAFYDKAGSAKVWVRRVDKGYAQVAATAD